LQEHKKALTCLYKARLQKIEPAGEIKYIKKSAIHTRTNQQSSIPEKSQTDAYEIPPIIALPVQDTEKRFSWIYSLFILNHNNRTISFFSCK
jgi:uncharacterized protein involved in tolerance to divalent cations